MSKEAMELALKALETAWYHVEIISGDWADRAKNAIKALEEALNQEQDEPVGWLDSNDIHAEFMHKDLKAEHDKRGSFTPRMFQIPVYTTLQQRTWIGLLDDEKEHIEIAGGKADLTLAEKIEAILKERNT